MGQGEAVPVPAAPDPRMIVEDPVRKELAKPKRKGDDIVREKTKKRKVHLQKRGGAKRRPSTSLSDENQQAK